MMKKTSHRMLSLVLAVSIIVTLFAAVPLAADAKTGLATDIGWPSFINLDPSVLQPGVPLDPSTNIRQAIYDSDITSGSGISFYIDRALNRPGNSSGDGNTVLTRGRSIFAVQSSVPTGLGWSNNVVWLDTANSFSPLNAITFRGNGSNISYTGVTASRNNNPSYWSSNYTTTDAAYSSVAITARKFISLNNVAVVILDIVNNGASEAQNISFAVSAASCATPGTLPGGKPELTGVKSVRANLTTLYPRITADLNGNPCTLSGTTLTTPTVNIPAGGKAQLKVVTGITTKELPESTADYLSYAADTADNAFKTQVRQYNKWYADTIPYIDIPNKAVQKAIEYRWWLTQYNTFDASLPGYDFQYPDTMEGVLGYNNNVVLTEGMRLQDTKWMRSAYLPYGTLLNVGNSSMSSAFLDNPGKIGNWNNHYGQYVGQAGLEAYMVHGGDKSIAEAFAYYFEHDAKGQLLHYGQHLPVTGRPTDAANNYGNAFLIAYRNAYMTGNDADTIDMAYPGAGTWKVRPESAYVYAAAKAAAELYDFVGDSAKALEMNTLAGNIQQDALNLLWSDKNKTFQSYAAAPSGSFVVDDPAQPNLIPWKVNNHYNFFSTYLVPQDPASVTKYQEAFEFFKYADEYPMFPCFTANQADKALYGGGTNNFSNINFTLQARAYEAAIRAYDPTHQYVTPEMLSMLTAWQAFEVYPVSNGSADTRYPNNNEYFYNYNSTTKQYTRSGIYHDTLGNFNYLFIEDMAGIRPRMDDVIELDPINFSSVNNTLANAADFKYDHFMVNNLNYHGSDLSIVWDDPSNPTPSYSAPKGYSLYIGGVRIFTVDHLAKILYDTQTGALTVDGHTVSAGDILYLKPGSTSAFLEAPEVDVKDDINPGVSENFKKAGIDLGLGLDNGENLTQIPGTTATASYTATARAASWFEKHRADGTDPTSKAVNEEPPSPAAAIDGTTVGEPFWGTDGSANAKDWLQITFPSAQTFNNVKLYFYNDRDGFGNGTAGQGYAEPVRYSIQYLNGANWTTVTNNNKTPSIPSANFNDALFDTVTSTAVRVVVEKNGSHPAAVAEAQVFKSSLTAAPVVNRQPAVTAKVGTTGNLSAQLLGTYADDGMPEDKDPSFRWSVVSAPAGALYQIADSNRMTASLVGDKAGDYSVKFSASDGEYTVEAAVTVTLAKAASADVAPSAANSANYTASWEAVTGPNNVSFEPTSSNPGTGKAWGNWNNGAPAWFQYTWSAPVYISSCDLYWYSDGSGTRVPGTWSIQYSDNGTAWTNVAVDASTPYSGAVATGKYNNVKFAPITARYLRVNITAIAGNAAGTGICRWKVYGPGIEKTADSYVMTPIGVQPSLPSTQTVTYDTGVRIIAPVTWSTVAPESLADENTFVVTGTVMGALTKANVYVRTDANVAQITDVWPMAITTAIGTAPLYPQYADVSYNNGGRTNAVVPVTWNAADQAAVDYTTAGDYTVKGAVQKGGDTAEATLTVTVRYDSSIPLAVTRIAPIALSTPAKIAPALPPEVTAKYNDGADRTVSVTWDNIDPALYAAEGSVFTVEGTVAGTSVKATANVTVTAPLPDTTPPGEVTDAYAIPGDGKLIILWTDPTDEDLDHVVISGGDIGPVTVGKGIQTATITGLTNDTGYTFTIAAADTAGNVSAGIQVTGTPALDTTPPGEVTDTYVIPGDGKLTVLWTDPADLDLDRVLVTTAGGIVLAEADKGEQRATITGLTNGTEYSFAIVTADIAGNMSAGVPVTGIPAPDTTAPSAVTGASVTAGDGKLTITWTDPADLDLDHIILSGGGIGSVTVGRGIQSAVITGLANGTEYTLAILAADIEGNISDGVTVTGTPAAAPDTTAPADVANASAAAGDGQMTITWTDPADADFDHVVISGGNIASVTVGKGIQTAVITNLTNGTEYTFTIAAADLAGNISAGVTVTGTPSAVPVPDTTAPAEVTGASVTADDGQLTIAWTDPEDADFYRVIITGEGIQPIVLAKGVQTATITGLTNGTAYTFRIATADTTGNVSDGVAVTGTPYVETPQSPGGNTGGSSSAPAVSAPKVEKGRVELPAPVVTNGTAKSGITGDTFNKALSGAAADENGKKTVTVNIPAASGASEYLLEMPSSALTSGTSNTRVDIVTEWARVEAPGNMFDSSDIRTNTVSLSVGKADKAGLKPEIAERIGDRPVIELNAYSGGGRLSWNNSEAPVGITMKYTPKSDEELLNSEFITVWYIDGEGNAVPVTNARYDAAKGEVSFTVTHFSEYAVVYAPKTFGDLAGHGWAKRSIDIMASKGAIYGTAQDVFSPSANITRADFLYFLIATLDLKAEFTENFGDVSADANYYDAVGIGKKLGIVIGMGDGKFDPLSQITRQDLMVMTAKALKLAKGLEDGSSADLAGYGDADRIRGSAQPSVAALVKAGVIVGENGRINPLSSTTRAEAAVIMYQLYNK